MIVYRRAPEHDWIPPWSPFPDNHPAGALHRPRSRPRSERRTAARPIPRTLLERRHDREPVRPEEAFGAVVQGPDLADTTAAEREEIAGLLKRHHLLVFRHQSLLTPEGQSDVVSALPDGAEAVLNSDCF